MQRARFLMAFPRVEQLPAFSSRVGISQSRHYSSSQGKVAVLYQELDPPVINGVQKPKKPGGIS